MSTRAAPTRQRALSGRLGIVALMALAVLFGANHIAARLAFDHGASVATGVFARSFCTAVGVLWALAAGVAFASALFMTDLWLKEVDGRVRSVVTMATVAAVVVAIGRPTGAFRAPADDTAWLGLALLSVFYGLAITGLFVLLPRLGSANYAVVLNFEPIALLVLGWLILGQAVSPSQVAGAFIVVGAIAWLGISVE